jgi:putative transposase
MSTEHFYTILRDVERNALRASLVPRARTGPGAWCSLRLRLHHPDIAANRLAAWPLPYPEDWLALVNEPQTEAELRELRQAVRRGSPFGSEPWRKQTARTLGLEATLRPRGRPRKAAAVVESQTSGVKIP